jgi:hypothetical protein
MSQFIGLALLPSTAATARLHLQRSCMKLNPAIASAGTPTLSKRHSRRVGPGSVFAIPTPVKHDLVNIGKETLRAVACFAAAMFTQNFDNVMMPPKSHIFGTPNREG